MSFQITEVIILNEVSLIEIKLFPDWNGIIIYSFSLLDKSIFNKIELLFDFRNRDF